MRVRIIYSETGTGEECSFDVEIKVLSGWAVAAAIAINEEDLPALTVLSFVVLGDKAAFIMSSDEDHFGQVLWTGFVYTNFIGEPA